MRTIFSRGNWRREPGSDTWFAANWKFQLPSCAGTFQSGNCLGTQITLKPSDLKAERMPTSMPTAAKATGAVSFAIVGWLIANAYVPGMPDALAAGGIREYSAAVGVFVGWGVMGNSVGHKYIDAIGHGWKTVIVLVFFAVLLFSIYEMAIKSTRLVYPGPIEAILDIFVRMFDRAKALLTFGVLVAMVIGGAVAGLVTEGASRRWR